MKLRNIILLIVLLSISIAGLFSIIRSKAPVQAVVPVAPVKWKTLLPSVTLTPGTYKLQWRNQGMNVGGHMLQGILRSANSIELSRFKGLRSKKSLIFTDSKFIALLDESKGTGTGYDTGYVICYPTYPHSVDLSDALKFSLTLKEEALCSDIKQPKTVIVKLGESGKQIVKSLRVNVQFYPPSSRGSLRIHHGSAIIFLYGEWYGKIATNIGNLNVRIQDANANNIYGENPTFSADGRMESYSDQIELGERKGDESDHDNYQRFTDVISYLGKLYVIRSSKAGDTLTIRPYTKATGTLCMNATDGKGVPATGWVSLKWPYGYVRVLSGRNVNLPVGDYRCSSMRIRAAPRLTNYKTPTFDPQSPRNHEVELSGDTDIPIYIQKNKTTSINIGGPVKMKLSIGALVNKKYTKLIRFIPEDGFQTNVHFYIKQDAQEIPIDFPDGRVYISMIDLQGNVLNETDISRSHSNGMLIPVNTSPGNYRVEARFDTGDYQDCITDTQIIKVGKETPAVKQAHTKFYSLFCD